MITGGANLNTPDTTVGHAAEIWSKRDAILERVKLSPYAVARITGQPVRWPSQGKLDALAALARLVPKPRPWTPLALPEIAATVGSAFEVTVDQMRAPAKGRHGNAALAVMAAVALSVDFTNRKPNVIGSFYGLTHRDSIKRLCRQHWSLARTDPIYRARFDAAKRALEACR